jgi:ribosomal protein S18 acetylase RimI-like enzyme
VCGSKNNDDFIIEKLVKIGEIIDAFMILKASIYDKTIFDNNNLKNYVDKIYNNGNAFVIKCDTKIIGLVAFYANDMIKKYAFITMIVIREDWQKHGFGKKLIELVKKESVSGGMTTLGLWVHKENLNARSFYKKIGFIETGKTNEKQNFAIMGLLE